MKRIVSFLPIQAIAPAMLVLGSNKAVHKPVNFVVIYLDDVGYGDLYLTGAVGYKTPNIDRMASEGMVFSYYYAPQAVYTASREGLLTGCYPNRVGLSGALAHKSNIGINSKEETGKV